MNVGSIVFDTNQGLGVLAKDFYDNGVVNTVLVTKHNRRERNLDWYGEDRCSSSEEFLNKIDVLLLFEDALGRWGVVKDAKKRGIPIVMMPMYECSRIPPPVEIDLNLCPSSLDLHFYQARGFNSVEVKVPVPDSIEWNPRTEVETFVFNVGNGGLKYRNGIPILLASLQYIEKPTNILIRAQEGSKSARLLREYKNCPDHEEHVNVDIRIGTCKYEHLFATGEMFIFLDSFSGLSLPLQEAYASGMGVIAIDRSPFNEWLPPGPLVKPHAKRRHRPYLNRVWRHYVKPQTVAAKIDEYSGSDIRALSYLGKKFREEMTWKNLKQTYINHLESVAR